MIHTVEEIARLPIHFNVPEHHLAADEYIIAIRSFNTCLNELNKRAFEGTRGANPF